jgi:voltage-gated potassium channel
MDPVRHLRFSIAALISIIGLGTFGYSLIEGWSAFDALYMAVITLATVGFKEVQPLTQEGKLFTIILIITGTGMIAYTLGSLLQFTLEGQLRKVLGRKKVESRISKLSGHYIICGFGRIGHLICKEFQAKPSPFVVVEKDPQHLELQTEEIVVASSSVLTGKTLVDAGIRQSMGIIIAGIKQLDGQMISNPPYNRIIEPHSTLTTLGERPAINQLEKIAGGTA